MCRANATIYNQQQFDYLNSNEYRESICATDPDSVPKYPTIDEFCTNQACKVDEVSEIYLRRRAIWSNR